MKNLSDMCPILQWWWNVLTKHIVSEARLLRTQAVVLDIKMT